MINSLKLGPSIWETKEGHPAIQMKWIKKIGNNMYIQTFNISTKGRGILTKGIDSGSLNYMD